MLTPAPVCSSGSLSNVRDHHTACCQHAAAMACRAEQPKLLDSGDENPGFCHLVSRVASMEPVDASILRATPASQVLQSCGAALRWTNQNLYERRFPVELIQVFWSHSWHGNHYMKRLLLLLLYNGPAAAIAANISALLVMYLQVMGLLPGISRVSRMTLGQEHGMALVFGPWCTLVAGPVFVIVLLGHWSSLTKYVSIRGIQNRKPREL